jgi:hypothetical protein
VILPTALVVTLSLSVVALSLSVVALLLSSTAAQLTSQKVSIAQAQTNLRRPRLSIAENPETPISKKKAKTQLLGCIPVEFPELEEAAEEIA